MFYRHKKTCFNCFQSHSTLIISENHISRRKFVPFRLSIWTLIASSSQIWASSYPNLEADFQKVQTSFSGTVDIAMNDMSDDYCSSVKRGAFILLEGVDRCGKTTQSKLLTEKLKSKGYDITPRRFPDRTTAIGSLINAYLTSAAEMDDKCIHLLFSANRWEASAAIEREILAGKTIVCDRYAYSGVAFSASKPDLSVDWCKAPDRGLPAPDVIIYLDLPIEQALLRGQYGEERYEKTSFQQRVKSNFMSIKSEEEKLGSSRWTVIDASKTIEDIHASICAIAEETICAVQDGNMPLKKLWIEKEINES